MHELTKLILEDMKPALGVTEPGAIAFACARARSLMPGRIRRLTVRLNSGMFKNAFTCGIPGSGHTGILYSAALGALAGDWTEGLEALAGVKPEDETAAEEMVRTGIVETEMTGITSRIFIEADLRTDEGSAVVRIRDSHTNITRIMVNGTVTFETEAEKAETEPACPENTGGAGSAGQPDTESAGVTGSAEGAVPKMIHHYTLADFLHLADTESLEALAPIREAFTMNLALLRQGLESPRTKFSKYLLRQNGGEVVSDDPLRTAQLLSAGAIEARVLGLSAPAMSITGSGSHGIIATLPLYAEAKIHDIPEEALLRATLLSFLVCTCIKEYSGRLSAFCGCGIAAGTGMACGLVYLRNGSLEDTERTIRNMAAGITGMICDGGNQGCVMKNITAVDAAFRAADLALAGIAIDPVHGILADTPEETMRNMGRIASPGMVKTEETITDIMREKPV